MGRGVRFRIVALVWGVLLTITTPAAFATSKSTNYQIDENAVGTGGYIDASSTNYSATSATDDLAAGYAASSSYQIQTGTKTTNDPTLSFAITNGSPSFGSFSAAAAATATTGFSVSNYSSYGYIVQLIGTAPTNGAHTITPLATTDISRPGVEQFGVNLVANTSPSSFGSNPDNGSFGFGSATANYNTSNQFRFVSGDTIAQSLKSSGVTNYTMSYIVNVSSLTQGGQYSSDQTLLVTGTY